MAEYFKAAISYCFELKTTLPRVEFISRKEVFLTYNFHAIKKNSGVLRMFKGIFQLNFPFSTVVRNEISKMINGIVSTLPSLPRTFMSV